MSEGPRRLEGWKIISAFVQRCESWCRAQAHASVPKAERLPIYYLGRKHGGKRGRPCADVAALLEWERRIAELYSNVRD